jgi:hypothetical protein
LGERGHATENRLALLQGLVLAAACLVLGAYHWGKLETLVAGDNVRWFFEAYRAARGEVLYRDFSFLYGPMGLWVFAAAMRLLGPTFVALQVTIDVLSVALCFATWRLARRVVPPGVALGVGLLTALGGAGNSGNFALFSLALYTPSLLTGLIGVLLFLVPLLDVTPEGERARRPSASQTLLLAVGGALACLSKVEFAVAVVAAYAANLALDLARAGRRDLASVAKRQALVGGCALGPSLLAYVLLATQVGSTNLLEALGGYGVSKQVCPWWPTGLGLLSGAAALGEALVIFALASLPRASALSRRYGSRYATFLAAAAIGAVLFVAQLPFVMGDFRATQGLTGPATWTSDLTLLPTYLLSFNGILLPVMWLGITLGAARAWTLASAAVRAAPAAASILPDRMLVIVAAATGISLRSLFSGLFGDVSSVNQSAYPLWFVLAAWLPAAAGAAWPAALSPGAQRGIPRAIAAVFVAYGMLRFGYRVHQMRAGGEYLPVATEAGVVRLHEHEVGPALYDWIVTSTPQDARLLEIPWGGGLTFASRRRGATFSTQFFGLSPSERIQQADSEQVEASPPDAVIAKDGPHLGTGFGLKCGCAFPRFAFRPPHLSTESHELPLVAQVMAYPAVLRVGAYVVRQPASARP